MPSFIALFWQTQLNWNGSKVQYNSFLIMFTFFHISSCSNAIFDTHKLFKNTQSLWKMTRCQNKKMHFYNNVLFNCFMLYKEMILYKMYKYESIIFWKTAHHTRFIDYVYLRSIDNVNHQLIHRTSLWNLTFIYGFKSNQNLGIITYTHNKVLNFV